MISRAWRAVVLIFCALSAAGKTCAEVLDYSGKIHVNGKRFHGKGLFVFSIHDTSGEILWASGDFPNIGSMQHPKAAWQITVQDGVYRTRLGDTAVGMPGLDMTRILGAKAPFLRVWFNDGSDRGWQIAGDTPVRQALAAEPTAPADGTISHAQAESIMRELREVKTLLQKSQPAAKPTAPAQDRVVTVPVGGSPSLGEPSAPAVLVEFTDYQCPYCKRAHDGLLADLKTKYIDTGKLRLVSRNLPLPFHPNAEPAAIAALCAGEQGKFWEMRERLFANTEALTRADFLKAAEELKLDAAAFTGCIDAKRGDDVVGRDKQDAAAAGINGTPSFVLGRANGDKVTGLLMIGAKPLPFVEAEIAKLLPPP